MKYREVPTTCKCGKLRRKGQRDCRDCHSAAGRRLRGVSNGMPPAEKLGRTMARIAKPSGRELPPGFKAKLDALAAHVAAEIERFNREADAGVR